MNAQVMMCISSAIQFALLRYGGNSSHSRNQEWSDLINHMMNFPCAWLMDTTVRGKWEFWIKATSPTLDNNTYGHVTMMPQCQKVNNDQHEGRQWPGQGHSSHKDHMIGVGQREVGDVTGLKTVLPYALLCSRIVWCVLYLNTPHSLSPPLTNGRLTCDEKFEVDSNYKT